MDDALGTDHRDTSHRSRDRRRPGRPRGSGLVATREQVIDAAISAIDAVGPGATMSEVADAAGVSKPIVYRMVGDKAALRTALSGWLIDRIDDATVAAQDAAATPRAQFRNALRAYFSVIEQHRGVFAFVDGAGQANGELGELVDRSARRMVDLFGTARSGAGLDPVGARTWAYGIIGALQTAVTMWVRDDYCDLDTLADDLTQLMWDGLERSLGVDGSA